MNRVLVATRSSDGDFTLVGSSHRTTPRFTLLGVSVNDTGTSVAAAKITDDNAKVLFEMNMFGWFMFPQPVEYFETLTLDVDNVNPAEVKVYYMEA